MEPTAFNMPTVRTLQKQPVSGNLTCTEYLRERQAFSALEASRLEGESSVTV